MVHDYNCNGCAPVPQPSLRLGTHTTGKQHPNGPKRTNIVHSADSAECYEDALHKITSTRFEHMLDFEGDSYPTSAGTFEGIPDNSLMTSQ